MNKQRILMVLGMAAFVVNADNWVVSPILPSIAQDLAVDIPRAALVITAYMIPFGLFQLVFGSVADRYGKVKVISYGMFFFTIASILCAIATGLTGLSIYRGLTGMFAASVIPVSMALIGDLFPIQERQTALGTFLAMAFLGQGLSMAIGGTIAYFLNWRGVFGLYAVLAAFATFMLLKESKTIPSPPNPQAAMIAPYINLLNKRTSLYIYLMVAAEGILLIGSFSFLGAFIHSHYSGFNNLQIGLVMTAYAVMMIIGGRITARITARIGKKHTIILGLALAVLAIFMLVKVPEVFLLLITGIALLGLGTMVSHSTFLTIVTELGGNARGVAMSISAACLMGGAGVGTAIGSRIVATGGYNWLYMIYAFCLMVLVGFVHFNQRSFDS